MAYLAVNRNGEELVFNDCPIYDRVEDTWKIPMLRWELVYDDPDDHSAGVHEDEVRDDDYGVTLPNGTIERIDNIMDLYKVLSFHKPQTQIIAVIHNPALIYKLSKLDCVNFIEMTKGYLKKITGFMNKK